MSNLVVNYPKLTSHPDLTEGDVDVLRNFEREVQKALPTLFCVMVSATWVYLPGHSSKYFRLVANTNPPKTIGEFVFEALRQTSRENFYVQLNERSFTAPDFKK